jgi:hypothetical protein
VRTRGAFQPSETKERIMLEGTAGDIKNIVLVHGGFVDASGWQAVYQLLRSEGFNVSWPGRTGRRFW